MIIFGKFNLEVVYPPPYIQELWHYKYANRLQNSIKQLKGEILQSITPEDLHIVEQNHQNLHKKYAMIYAMIYAIHVGPLQHLKWSILSQKN